MAVEAKYKHVCPDKKTSGQLVSRKKRPSIKRNTAKKTSKKKSYKYFGEYKDFFTHKMTPVSERFLDRLAEDILNWAITEKKAYTTDKFWYTKGISPRVAARWRERYKPLSDAYNDAQIMIGIRREEGSLTKVLDSNTFFRTAYFYSPAFVKTAEWQAELKQKHDEKTQQNNIQWMLDKFPDSKIVPKKKDEDE